MGEGLLCINGSLNQPMAICKKLERCCQLIRQPQTRSRLSPSSSSSSSSSFSSLSSGSWDHLLLSAVHVDAAIASSLRSLLLCQCHWKRLTFSHCTGHLISLLQSLVFVASTDGEPQITQKRMAQKPQTRLKDDPSKTPSLTETSISASLRSSIIIKELVLVNPTPSVACCVVRNFRHHQSLVHLELAVELSHSIVNAFAESLQSHSAQCMNQSQHSHVQARTFKNVIPLRSLDLSASNLPRCNPDDRTAIVSKLAAAIAHLTQLQSLRLSYCGLDDEHMAHLLTSGVSRLEHLLYLYLDNNLIGPKNIHAIADILSGNQQSSAQSSCALPSLLHLDLHNQDVWDDRDYYAIFFRALSHNASLQYLNLAGNFLHDGLAQSMATSLVCNTSLKELILSDNLLGDTFAHTLGCSMQQIQGLESLHLMFNSRLSKDLGWAALAQGMRQNWSLCRVLLHEIDSAGHEERSRCRCELAHDRDVLEAYTAIRYYTHLNRCGRRAMLDGGAAQHSADVTQSLATSLGTRLPVSRDANSLPSSLWPHIFAYAGSAENRILALCLKEVGIEVEKAEEQQQLLQANVLFYFLRERFFHADG